MDAKPPLHAPETHPLVDRLQNLLAHRFTMGHRLSLRVEAATTHLASVRLGAVSGFSVFKRLDTLTGRALGHPSVTSRHRSHYPLMLCEGSTSARVQEALNLIPGFVHVSDGVGEACRQRPVGAAPVLRRSGHLVRQGVGAVPVEHRLHEPEHLR